MTALLNTNYQFFPFQNNTIVNVPPLTAPSEEAPRRVSLDEDCLQDILANLIQSEQQHEHNTKRKRVVEPDEVATKKPKTLKLLRFLAEPIVMGTAASIEHKSDVWYSRDELAEIRRNAKVAVLKTTTAAGEISDLYHDTTSSVSVSQEFLGLRGLERWTSKKHYQTRQVQSKSLRSELWIEQSTQRFLTGYNPERLATISRNHSATAKVWAQRLALVDAQQDDP